MQAICFFILYAIWGLPETILVRNFCLILGCLISIFEFYVYRKLLATTSLFPLMPILALFIWISFHLLFLSNSYSMQLIEFTGIWKRVLIGSIFAIGFGLSLTQLSDLKKDLFFKIIFFSSISPIIIFYIKYLNTINFIGINLDLNFLLLYTASAKFFIPKTTYVCFGLPALAIALTILEGHIVYKKFSGAFAIFALLVVFAIFLMFYILDIKNGALYSIILFFILVFIIVKKFIFIFPFRTIFGFLIILFFSSIIIYGHIQNNPSWRSIIRDAKIAVKIDEVHKWKFPGSNGYPRNELGEVVSVTNYERIAWGITGVNLLIKNPLGYGLVERSYGQLAAKEYPGSRLSQSHSGWLDLALGIGLPGLSMIFLSLAISLWQARQNHNYWKTFIFWATLAGILMWCTTELSQKVYFDSLMFWVCLFLGLTLNPCPIRRVN
jgi:hypothetical protein